MNNFKLAIIYQLFYLTSLLIIQIGGVPILEEIKISNSVRHLGIKQ